MDQHLIDAAAQSIARGRAWLIAHDNEIRAIQDLNAHYKAPYLYASLGDPLRARYYGERLRQQYLQPDGDFRTSKDSKGWRHLSCSPANRYVYSNGWMIVGLRRLGMLGLASKGMNFVKRFQDPTLGGFYSRFDAVHGRPDPTYLDTSSTSSAGMALIACGDINAAVRAGDFVLHMLAAQTERQNRFFASWINGRGLHTDIQGDEDQNALHGRKQFCLDVSKDPRLELTWLVGKPMKFLAMLYDQTGERRFLQGAIDLFDFFHRLSPERWENLASCKIMWGSASLYRLTGEARFAETAEKILAWICESQLPDGVWLHRLWHKRIEDQPFAGSLDIVQEFGGEISDVLLDLSAAP